MWAKMGAKTALIKKKKANSTMCEKQWVMWAINLHLPNCHTKNSGNNNGKREREYGR